MVKCNNNCHQHDIDERGVISRFAGKTYGTEAEQPPDTDFETCDSVRLLARECSAATWTRPTSSKTDDTD